MMVFRALPVFGDCAKQAQKEKWGKKNRNTILKYVVLCTNLFLLLIEEQK